MYLWMGSYQNQGAKVMQPLDPGIQKVKKNRHKQ